MHKKIILFISTLFFLASCGVQKKASYPIAKADGIQSEILEYGMKHLNKPYRYAGKGPSSFDCSGFTSFVFKEFGYRLSTSSPGQARQVPSISRKEDLRVGDLVFFEGQTHNESVGHVGIVKEVLPNGNFTFLHASTSFGVIVSRSTEPYYSSRYLYGGRVLRENNQIVLSKNNRRNSNIEASVVNELRKAKQNNTENKEPVIVKAPKTKTEQELELASNASNNVKNDSIIIHTRQIAFPVSNESPKSKEEKDKEATISKDARRSNNRGVPKPKMGGKDPLLYKVMAGDTLYSISNQHSCSLEQLRQWNPHIGSTLKAGETISIYQ